MIVKEERANLENTIYQARFDVGLQAMRDWLYVRQVEINGKWHSAIGDDLIKMQGEASSIMRQIKMLEKGPTVPQQTKEMNNG